MFILIGFLAYAMGPATRGAMSKEVNAANQGASPVSRRSSLPCSTSRLAVTRQAAGRDHVPDGAGGGVRCVCHSLLPFASAACVDHSC